MRLTCQKRLKITKSRQVGGDSCDNVDKPRVLSPSPPHLRGCVVCILGISGSLFCVTSGIQNGFSFLGSVRYVQGPKPKTKAGITTKD